MRNGAREMAPGPLLERAMSSVSTMARIAKWMATALARWQPMFKGGQRARAVAIHLAMRAIVETEDIARSSSGPGAISRAPLRMLGDGLQARNQPLQRPLLPITRKQCPHHRAVAKLAGRGNNPRIAKPKRRTKPFWRRA